MPHHLRIVVAFALVASVAPLACVKPPPEAPPPVVGTVVCPEGSVFDPARSLCVARELMPVPAGPKPPPIAAQPDEPDEPDTVATVAPPPPPPTAAVTVAAPPARAGNVTVTCGFGNGWVSVLPVAKYPKDDSFLMQALIGFTQDPKFWGSEPQYAPLKPFAAKRCGSTPIAIPVPAAGDYWLLVGQEGTFSARGKYDKNGVKRRITVSAQGASAGVGTSDLTDTWLCISCPWVRTYAADGAVATSFVVLAGRSSSSQKGTDRVPLRGAPVVRGRVVVRVLEREDELTRLDELVLVVRDAAGREHALFPRHGGARSALAAADGALVELRRGTGVALEYELPPELAGASTVDGTFVATGYYDPAPPVVDLHVDLGDAVHRRGSSLASADLDANADRLARGNVTALVAPLFVADAELRAPADVRAEYAAIQGELARALAASGWSGHVTYAFEGADGFADDPSALAAFAKRGACLLGVVHSRTNALGGSSQEPAAAERRRGLTARGRAVAEAALAAGMLLDVAHASDETFDDLAALAAAAGRPFVDSHTGARALVPIERNLDDARMARVARSGGVVAIDLHGGHVASAPGERPTLDDVAAHIEHAVAVAGAEHVALGSDLAGGITGPSADGAAVFPELAARLRARGVLSERVVAAVFGENARRVLAQCPR